MLALYTFVVLSCSGGDGLICKPVIQQADLMVNECAQLAARVQPVRLQRVVCSIQRNS